MNRACVDSSRNSTCRYRCFVQNLFPLPNASLSPFLTNSLPSDEGILRNSVSSKTQKTNHNPTLLAPTDSKRWETLKSRESLSSTPANSCITAHLQGETQSSEASINRDLFTAWITGSRQRGLGTVNAGMLSRLRGLGAGEPRRRCHPVG